jgi:hypothetical protein
MWTSVASASMSASGLERIRGLAIPPAWSDGVRARTRIERAVTEPLEE